MFCLLLLWRDLKFFIIVLLFELVLWVGVTRAQLRPTQLAFAFFGAALEESPPRQLLKSDWWSMLLGQVSSAFPSAGHLTYFNDVVATATNKKIERGKQVPDYEIP